MTTTTILRLPHLLPFECLAPGRSFLGCFVFVLWCEGPGKFRKALKFVGNFFASFNQACVGGKVGTGPRKRLSRNRVSRLK